MRVLTAEELDWVSGGTDPGAPPMTTQECQDLYVDYLLSAGNIAVAVIGAGALSEIPPAAGVAWVAGVGGAVAHSANLGNRYDRDCPPLKDSFPDKPFPGDPPFPLPRDGFSYETNLSMLPDQHRTV